MLLLWLYLVKPLLAVTVGSILFATVIFSVIYLLQLKWQKKGSIFDDTTDVLPLFGQIGMHLSISKSAKYCGNYDIHSYNFLWYLIHASKHEGYAAVFLGDAPKVAVFRADLVEKVFSNSVNIKKGPMYKLLTPWLGDGLLTSHGSKWKSRRKFLTPAFHFKILNTFAVIMNRQAKVFTDLMEKQTITKDMLTFVEAFTLDVVCETIMGVSMNCQVEGSGRDYLTTVKNLSHLIIERFLNPVNRIDFIYFLRSGGREFTRLKNQLHQFTLNVIEERKAELLQNLDEKDLFIDSEEAIFKSKKPFLDLMLMEHLKNQSFSIQDIREEVDTFMFEGHDTTAMGLTWALYFIGLHQDVQHKIHEEIDRVFQGNSTCEVTAEHIKELKYLEMTLKESQRLCPSVTFVTREVVKEFTIEGRQVPLGSELVVLIQALHHDPKVFPRPFEFDPERFSMENCQGRHPYAFVPFSAGLRNCIGQRFALLEEKILLVWMLRKFEIRSLDPRDEILMKTDMVLRPQTAIRIAIKSRC